jgi:tetratricopeptide (TPR) repeat protein
MAEHRMYLPLASVVTGVVIGIYLLLGRRSLPVFVALALGLGLLAIRRNEDYRTKLSIWSDTVAKCPGNARAHTDLGGILLEAGHLAEALAQREEALRINPTDPQLHYNLAHDLAQLGRVSEAIVHYEFALRVNPDFDRAQNNLAWLLATRPPTEGGDPVRAVVLAERACKLSGDRMAIYLDTLAAAYAAAGRFNDAIATAGKAVEVARANNESSLAEKIEGRLQLYRNGRAYSQSADVSRGTPTRKE